MLKVYLVDDEPLARDELKYLLQRSQIVTILGESDCIDDAMIDIPKLKPDIVFLDIELTEGSGLQLARMVNEFTSKPNIVFVTAYDEYALQAFDLNAIDYLLKPINEARLYQTLEKITGMRKESPPSHQEVSAIEKKISGKLAVMIEDRIVLIPIEDIKYVEASEGKSIIYTDNERYKVNEALVVLEKKLDTHTFLRVHRSYLVNWKYIKEIEPWVNSTFTIILEGKCKVPVSRTYMKELKKHLNI